MKVVINREWGTFSLSPLAQNALREMGVQLDIAYPDNTDFGMADNPHWHMYRTDPRLIQVVEKYGVLANGVSADLKIVEIPDDVEWYIANYHGMEVIHEVHRQWS